MISLSLEITIPQNIPVSSIYFFTSYLHVYSIYLNTRSH